MTLLVYLCPFVLPALTRQKTAAWLSSASLWCLLMAPKCTQTISCSTQISLLMHFFFFCACSHKGNNVCVYICFLAFSFSGMAFCSFPLFQTLQSHIKIDIFDVTWIQKYISVLMWDRRLTHNWCTSFWKTQDWDWRWACALWAWFTQLSAQIRWIHYNEPWQSSHRV